MRRVRPAPSVAGVTPTSTLRALRTGAARLHLALAVLIVAGVFVQVYLIGAYVFGAGIDALDAHESVGFTVHGLEMLILLVALAAWLPRADLALSLALAVGGTVQVMFASSTGPWVAALHPLGALLVLVVGALLARRGLARLPSHAR
jgi:hypothetical protein